MAASFYIPTKSAQGFQLLYLLVNTLFHLFFFFLKRDFPGGPVTGTLSSQRRGLELDPWLENRIPHAASWMLQLRPITDKQTNVKKKKKVVVFMYISSINFYRSILISGPCRVWDKIDTIICCISHDTIQWKMLTGDQIHVRWTRKQWGPLEPDTLRQIFPATSWLCNWTSCFSIVLYLPHLWNGYPHCSRMLWGLSEDPQQVWHSAWFAAILRKW